MKVPRISMPFALLTFWVLLSAAAHAGDWIKPGEETFFLSGGVFFPAFDTNLRVDSVALGRGTEVNLEDDLRFDDAQTTFYAGGYWRFASHHRFAVAYFEHNRSASATLEGKLVIGEEIYPLGAGVKSDLDFRIIPIRNAYSFLKEKKFF